MLGLRLGLRVGGGGVRDSRIRVWILNTDLTPQENYKYVWKDTELWVDDNIWKD